MHPESSAKYVEFFVVKIAESLVKDALLMILVFTQHIGVMNAKLREEMESRICASLVSTWNGRMTNMYLVMSVSRRTIRDSNIIIKMIIEGYYN